MWYGEVAKRAIPETDVEKKTLIKEMVGELLDRVTPVFDTTTFIVHFIDGNLTVGMKWEN